MKKRGVELEKLELAFLIDRRLEEIKGALKSVKSLVMKGKMIGKKGKRDFDLKKPLSGEGFHLLFSEMPELEELEMWMESRQVNVFFKKWKEEKKPFLSDKLKRLFVRFHRTSRKGEGSYYENRNQLEFGEILETFPQLERLELDLFDIKLNKKVPENKLKVVSLENSDEDQDYIYHTRTELDFVSLLSSTRLKEFEFGRYEPKDKFLPNSGLLFDTVEVLKGCFEKSDEQFGNFVDCFPNLKCLNYQGYQSNWLDSGARVYKLEKLTVSKYLRRNLEKISVHLPLQTYIEVKNENYNVDENDSNFTFQLVSESPKIYLLKKKLKK